MIVSVELLELVPGKLFIMLPIFFFIFSAFLMAPWLLLLEYQAMNASLLVKNQAAGLQVLSNRNHTGFGDEIVVFSICICRFLFH
jgi:hypothetical protein